MKLVFAGIAVLALTGCGDGSGKVVENSASTSEPMVSGSPSPDVTNASPSVSDLTDPMPNSSSIPEKPTVPDAQPVQKPGQSGWSTSKLKLADVGKRIGTSLTTLKGAECRARVLATTSEVRGMTFLVYLVDTPNLYRMEYVDPSSQPKKNVILSDGKTKRELTPKGLSAVTPVAKPMIPLATLSDPNRFAREFTRSLIAGVVDRSNAWGELVSNLTKPNSGFTASLEERHPIVNDKPTVNYRIFAKRTPASAKKLGAAEFEIVLDPNRWVPVTIRTQSTDLKGNKWSYDWTAGWKFNQTIDKSLFTFKTPPMPLTPAAPTTP